ncbi:MAG: hypothetical protein V3U54_12995 [Thermodesulfobacteriota bacterium]
MAIETGSPIYCLPRDVSSLLRLVEKDKRIVFSAKSHPSRKDVERWILEAERWIDEETGQAWRTTIVTEETHSNLRHNRRHYTRHGIPRHSSAVIVYLEKRNIFDLSKAAGDKLEVWNGASYIDLVDTGTPGVGPRDGDYWVDLRAGRIELYTGEAQRGRGTIRVTYRHGRLTVPSDIHEAAKKLTAVNFLVGEDYIHLFPDNPQAIQQEVKAEAFRVRVAQIINRYKELIVR